MNTVFEDNGMCLVLLSFLQEEQLEHSEVWEQLAQIDQFLYNKGTKGDCTYNLQVQSPLGDLSQEWS